MSSLNKIILIGNLTSDPDIKETTNGQLLSRFTIAVDRPSQQDAMEKQTDYISVVAWRDVAESTQQISKGSQCLVEGKVITRTYDDDDGKRHYITEVESRSITPLSSKQAAPSKKEAAILEESPLEESPLEESKDSVSFDFNIDDVPNPAKEPASSPVNLGADIEENIPF